MGRGGEGKEEKGNGREGRGKEVGEGKEGEGREGEGREGIHRVVACHAQVRWTRQSLPHGIRVFTRQFYVINGIEP